MNSVQAPESKCAWVRKTLGEGYFQRWLTGQGYIKFFQLLFKGNTIEHSGPFNSPPFLLEWRPANLMCPVETCVPLQSCLMPHPLSHLTPLTLASSIPGHIMLCSFHLRVESLHMLFPLPRPFFLYSGLVKSCLSSRTQPKYQEPTKLSLFHCSSTPPHFFIMPSSSSL